MMDEDRLVRQCVKCKRFFGVGKLWYLDLCTTTEFNHNKITCGDDVKTY